MNDAPTASPQSLTTPEQSPLDIVLVGNDVEGDTLTFTVVSQPLNGILAGVAPNLTYTANADFIGSDSFTFTVSDGTMPSEPATIAIEVEERRRRRD